MLAGADHGDGAHGIEDAAQIVVRVCVLIHRAAQPSSQRGGRFSRKASTPSSVSRAAMFLAMTSVV